jgi:hypothetical protein
MFIVIENTPGYLPEDDDPATFDSIEDARVYASDRLSSLLDFIVEGQMDEEPPSGFRVEGSFQDSMSVVVYDNSRIHDLGRVIEIVESEEAL